MPADLDQFGGNNSHRAVIGGEGFIELGHMSTNSGLLFDQVNFESGGSEIEGGLNTTDTPADHHHISKIAFCEVFA